MKETPKDKEEVKSGILALLLQRASKQTLIVIITVLVSFMLGGIGLSGLQSIGGQFVAEQATATIKQSNDSLITVLQRSINVAAEDRLDMKKFMYGNANSIDTLSKSLSGVKQQLEEQIARGTGSLEDQIEHLESTQQQTLDQILNALKDQ